MYFTRCTPSPRSRALDKTPRALASYSGRALQNARAHDSILSATEVQLITEFVFHLHFLQTTSNYKKETSQSKTSSAKRENKIFRKFIFKEFLKEKQNIFWGLGSVDYISRI